MAAAVEISVVFCRGSVVFLYNAAMAALELRFLGDLAVVRNGVIAPLPPSRKTRALLAYLALNRRAFRREHLCELLWDIPDDPRGSLRWSLSKLRHLVDDETHQRIVANRTSVAFDATDAAVDLVALKALADSDLAGCPLEQLEEAAARYSGNPLEGIELPDFHDFDAWCVSQRESATAAQARILSTVIQRLTDDPQRALPHARELVRVAPYDEKARAALIRLLVALGRSDQAEQQYQVGVRMLKEAGAPLTGELQRALRGVRGTQLSGAGSRDPSEPSHRPITHNSSPASSDSPLQSGLLPTPEPHRLVGRDTQVRLLSTALARSITQRRGAGVLVCGEPGIGKSCLLEVVADCARVAGAWLLEACAYESESVRPFALWTDALRKAGPEPSCAVFGDQMNRERLFSALSDMVAERSRTRPVVLIFDDMQWSDESSAAALHYVVRTNKDQPLFVVLAAREDELRDNTPALRAVRELRQANLLEELHLDPLPQEAVRELITMRSPQLDSERLSRECGGNPLLAIELARAEAAGDSGQSLGDLVQERLARFDAEGGDVLHWAAVLAPRIDTATLVRVTGLDWNRIGEVLETAARQCMLQQAESGFRFSHDLIARSIYARISPARRRTMHRRIAEMLEQDTALAPERASDLAHHASQSGDPALTARAMIFAGQLCLRFFANDEALLLARKGLQWVTQLPTAQRVCLTLELREIMLSAGPIEHWETAAREYATLAEQALDHGALSHARRGYYMASYVRWMHGHWTGAREEILQAERVVRGGSEEEHIIGMAEAARCLAMLERDLPHADAMLMEAQRLAARKHVRHHAIAAALGMLRFHENHLDEAGELFKEARTLARSCGDRINEFQASEYLAMIDIERGRPEAARAHCAVLIELGQKLRDGSERPFAHALDALCAYALTGDSAPLESSLEGLRAADAKHRLAYTLTRAALIDVDRQRPEAAIAHAGEALAYAEALDRATELLLAHVALARARWARNDADGYSKHIAALAELKDARVAGWARKRAAELAALPAQENCA